MTLAAQWALQFLNTGAAMVFWLCFLMLSEFIDGKQAKQVGKDYFIEEKLFLNVARAHCIRLWHTSKMKAYLKCPNQSK